MCVLAISFPTPWNVTASNNEDGSVLFDLTHYPNSKDVAFFIISLNTTQQRPKGCENHHGEEDKPPPRYLHMVSSSDTLANVSGIPESSTFQVVVYLVDDNRDVYRSEQFSLKTAEGGEYHQ